MTEVNFIPASYVLRQQRRRSSVRQAALIVVLAALLAMWYTASSRSLGELGALVENVEREAATAQARVNEINHLREVERELRRDAKTRQELSPTINTVDVVGTVANAMPTSIALRAMDIMSERPVPQKASNTDDANPAAGETPRAIEPMKISLVGLAPADVEVADFVGQLTKSPLFHNVKMVYSRPVQTQDVHAREFRIEFEVPLDCDYQPADGKGVALAD